MDRDKAIQFALSHRPESIGLARLCQELLADVAGKPVTAETPRSEPMKRFIPRPANLGNRHNPWGRAGKPQ
jgi:hypothetical protein